MPDAVRGDTTGDDLDYLAADSALQARTYLNAVSEVASGSSPEIAIPILLLATSQLLVMGSRLGAIQDVVLDERFEADPGPDPDVEPLRDNIANLFEGLDDYADVVDPVTQADLTKGSLSADIAEIRSRCCTGCRTSMPAGAWRRCGGGSSRTCRRGGSGPRRPCACCSRSLATFGWTPTRTWWRTPSSTPCTDRRLLFAERSEDAETRPG